MEDAIYNAEQSGKEDVIRRVISDFIEIGVITEHTHEYNGDVYRNEREYHENGNSNSRGEQERNGFGSEYVERGDKTSRHNSGSNGERIYIDESSKSK